MVVVLFVLLIIGFTIGGLLVYYLNRNKEMNEQETALIEQMYHETENLEKLEFFKLENKRMPRFEDLTTKAKEQYVKWLVEKEKKERIETNGEKHQEKSEDQEKL